MHLAAPVQAALAAALLSAVTALVMAFLNLRLQKRIEERKAELQEKMEGMRLGLQTQLEQLKASLVDDAAAKSARRAYEYEMRKRLYSDCEPLFFHLSEAADLALRRCRDLALPKVWQELRPKRQNLDARTGAWMLTNSSELIAITYALFAPLALYVLLRGKLTMVDCTLDQSLFFRFRMARELYEVLQSDGALASCDPALDYNPLVPGWREKRLERPSVHWWQGLSPGRLDRAVHLLIAQDGGARRLLSFGEFEDLYLDAYDSGEPYRQKILGLAANALYGFTPPDRPVFWRLIMVQVHIYHALRRPAPDDVGNLLRSPAALRNYLHLKDYGPYDWSRNWPECVGAAHYGNANEIALNYLVDRLSEAPAP